MTSFVPIIERFGSVPDFARAIGMTVGAAKQARRRDSIPAEWFSAVSRAAVALGLDGINEAILSEIAEQRRIAKLAQREAA